MSTERPLSPDDPVVPERPVGVVLVGGASKRMGRDKSSIEVRGRTLAERAVAVLSGCCSEVLLAGRAPTAGPHAGDPRARDIERVDDGPGSGPAAGILGAAAERPGRALLVLACDLPLVPAELLELLAASTADVDLVVPGRSGRLEPLCALYRPRALEALADQVAAGGLAPHRLAERRDLRVRIVGEGELRAIGDPATMFANVNRPEDLTAIEPLLS